LAGGVVVVVGAPPGVVVVIALPDGVVTVVVLESVGGGVAGMVVVAVASAAGGVVATVVVSFLVQPARAAKPRVTAAATARGLVRRMSGDLRFECLRPTTEHHG
jgi:hypothetical protein